MKRYLLVFMLVLFTLPHCTTLSTSVMKKQDTYKVFVVDQRPTHCEQVSYVQGVGTESFEGNEKYAMPLAMLDIKKNTSQAGGNVVFVQTTKKEDNSIIIGGEAFKCQTMRVSREELKKTRMVRMYKTY